MGPLDVRSRAQNIFFHKPIYMFRKKTRPCLTNLVVFLGSIFHSMAGSGQRYCGAWPISDFAKLSSNFNSIFSPHFTYFHIFSTIFTYHFHQGVLAGGLSSANPKFCFTNIFWIQHFLRHIVSLNTAMPDSTVTVVTSCHFSDF